MTTALVTGASSGSGKPILLLRRFLSERAFDATMRMGARPGSGLPPMDRPAPRAIPNATMGDR